MNEGYWSEQKILGFGKYKIPKESAETVHEWRSEVDKILADISSAELDKEKLKKELSGEKPLPTIADRAERLTNKAVEMLKTREWDERSKTLLAIGLWLMSKKGKWSDAKQLLNSLVGGTYQMAPKIESRDIANCVESATMAKVMASEFGIEGEILTTGMNIKLDNLGAGYGHHFFQDDRGHIVDIYWARKQCGYFDDIVEMIKNGKTPEDNNENEDKDKDNCKTK